MELQTISIHNLRENCTFSADEALNLITILNTITSKTKKELSVLNSQMQFLKRDSEKAELIQIKINKEIQSWSDKMRRLGVIPVSLSKVRIISNDGDFMWEFPDNKLMKV